ncbi:MAG TPA: transcription antitermination factor NusB [Chromatiales bacterium]|nr:transcription antitermination factor NusB [Chromatiales bacterium]
MTSKRSKAREQAVQALYQWQLTGQNLDEIDAQFLEEPDALKIDVPYFKLLLHEVPKHLGTLDEQLREFLDRAIENVDPVERAVLRLGAYELIYRPEVPYRVVINEAVELAKTFGSEQGHRYVNGVLDKLAQKVRSVEASVSR